MSRTVYRTCSLCEVMCGLELEVEDGRITAVRPDEQDVLSRGFICPKGAAMAEVAHDPDRVRTPLKRTPGGDFEPIGWEEALRWTADQLRDIRRLHGADAVAAYLGNPIVHNHGALALRAGLLRALGTKNATSASSQDTAPRFAASYYLYGSSLYVPVPDVDRTDYLLCLGANPRVSNGSLLSAPNMRGRLRGILDRGGKVVVVDPRRTETARDASEHIAIRPGGDAALLLAMVQSLVANNRVDVAAIEEHARGWATIAERLPRFTPERVAHFTAVDAATIHRLAAEFVDAPTSAAYSRVGVCNSAYGTLATFATDLLNLVAGRLGVVGGAMFNTPAADTTPVLQLTKSDGHARWRSRVRGLPETLGDLPASILAEEIETPGEGQVRALLTYAGNPVLSTPNGRRLSAALEKLEFMVSIDLYVNETTRHADVILPSAGALAHDHYDLMFSQYAVKNVARWSPAVLPKAPEEKHDWQIILDLIYRLGGGPMGNAALDRLYRWGRFVGMRWTPDKAIDLLLRVGPYGDRFLPWKRGLNLKRVKQAEHGIDLGPLEPGIARRVLHRDGKVWLDPPPLVAAIDALDAELDQPVEDNALQLIGRRELRSCNSWMHNIPSLVSGKPRCVLYVHPEDAQRAGVRDGDEALLESRTHTGRVPVHVTDDVREGVVSLPHGWGHAEVAPWQTTAGNHPGVSMNDWTDDQQVEMVVGQSILNGVKVKLRAVEALPTNGEAVQATAVKAI